MTLRHSFYFLLFSCCYRDNMGINTLIPVQIAFHIDNIADLQVLDSCVYIGGIVAKIRLYNEGIGLAIQGNAEVPEPSQLYR